MRCIVEYKPQSGPEEKYEKLVVAREGCIQSTKAPSEVEFILQT